jgi:heptosyltransferase-2
VLTTPVIRVLRKHYPLAQIDFLTKENFVPLLEQNPYLNNIFTLEATIKATSEKIVKGQYDLVIDLHKNLRTKALYFLSPISTKWLTYDKKTFRKWSAVHFKIAYPKIHVTEQYFTAVKSLGIKNDGLGLEFHLTQAEIKESGIVPFTHSAGFAVFALSATHFTKKMPFEQWEILCREIKMPVILIGGTEEAEMGKQLEALDDFKIINRCGKMSLRQSAALIQKAKYVVTHDTGMMHIAAAFNKKIYSIWGGTIPEMGFYPLVKDPSKNILLEVENLNCRPCSKYGRENCPKGHFKCMKTIDISPILNQHD